MKRFLLPFLLLCFLSNGLYAQLNMELSSQVEYNQSLNDIWGWFNEVDDREYALVGVRNRMSVIDVTDPKNPVDRGFAPGPRSTWRDIKTWGNYAFCVNDTPDDGTGPSQGVLVMNLGNLPDSITEDDYSYWRPTIERDGITETITRCHNIYIDEFGFGYLAGCDANEGGLIFIDVRDGANPTIAGLGAPVYSHDVYTRDNLAYSAEINAGRLAVYDVSDKSDPQLRGTTRTPFRFTHNVWLSDDGNAAFTTDERQNAFIGSYDVSDPSDIIELDRYRPLATEGSGVVPHNVHVWENWLIISYYTDGCILVDANRPHNLIEVGNFDTFVGGDGEFLGIWGAYPFLPSGIILGTDISQGLFVFEPNYVRGCYLEGMVIDSITRDPIQGADVRILGGDLNRETSSLQGTYATGQVTSGTFEVEYSRVGYKSKRLTVELENGVVTMQDAELVADRNVFALNGEVVVAGSDEPIEGAIVEIFNNEFEYQATTDDEGNISRGGIFEGSYTIIVGKWGFKTQLITLDLFSNNESFVVELEEGYRDEFILDLGWDEQSDATTGLWERGEPVGTLDGNGQLISPDEDLPNDLGDQCYVTGNLGGRPWTDDVDNGTTNLISPKMALTSIPEPLVRYQSWFQNVDGALPRNDTLIVYALNGQTEVIIDKITDVASEWKPVTEIRLSEFLDITDEMQIRFSLFDGTGQAGGGHIVEAAIDGFEVVPGIAVSTEQPNLEADLLLEAAPNPFGESFTLSYELKTSERAQLELINALGQQIYSRQLTEKRDVLSLGEDLPEGVYFVKISTNDQKTRLLRVVKQ
ncbi:MAG: choice-of-anchor B family protein [Bacteroidota bacterium]